MNCELKIGTDIAAFLNTAGNCPGDVLFEDEHGNRMNLKDELARYLFLASEKDKVFVTGTLFCSEEVANVLEPYII